MHYIFPICSWAPVKHCVLNVNVERKLNIEYSNAEIISLFWFRHFLIRRCYMSQALLGCGWQIPRGSSTGHLFLFPADDTELKSANR